MPQFDKVKGKVVKVTYSKAEQQAMEAEIRRQAAEYDRAHENEIDAMMLWSVHKLCGFGPKRLKDFYFGFQPILNDLLKRFECCTSDTEWACTEALKEYGIDIEEWRREFEKLNADG